MEEYEQENAPPVKKGFQVVGANMFSQTFEPVVRISNRSISYKDNKEFWLNILHKEFHNVSH